MEQARMILLESGLSEAYKWKQPCYTKDNKNIAVIGSFKNYCCISFFKGALLKDPKNILTAPGENSQTFRQFRFTTVDELIKNENILREYIQEAVEIEKSRAKVQTRQELEYPQELSDKMSKDVDFKHAFEALTPGRQRAYLLFFSAAKQAATRESRIEKYSDRILKGKGINDCVCGLSKRMPQCDGSHKQLEN